MVTVDICYFLFFAKNAGQDYALETSNQVTYNIDSQTVFCSVKMFRHVV